MLRINSPPKNGLVPLVADHIPNSTTDNDKQPISHDQSHFHDRIDNMHGPNEEQTGVQPQDGVSRRGGRGRGGRRGRGARSRGEDSQCKPDSFIIDFFLLFYL